MLHSWAGNLLSWLFSNGLTFYAPLTTSLIPAVGFGAPSFTRATLATVEDHERILRYALSGEARFQGARRVRNLILGSSDDLTNSAWVKDANGTATFGFSDPIGGLRASRWVTTASAVRVLCGTGVASFPSVDSVWLRGEVGGEQVEFGDQSSRITLTLTNTWRRYSYYQANTGSAFPQLRSVSASPTTIYVYGFQREDVTGQSNQNPSEYVSVGAAKLNELTYTSEFDNAVWAKANATVTANAAVAPDGTTTADKVIGDVSAIGHSVTQTITGTTSGDVRTGTVHAKAAEYSYVRVYLFGGTSANRHDCIVNLTTGAIEYSISAGTYSGGTFAVTAASNGYWRIQLTGALIDTNARIAVFPQNGPLPANTALAGDATSGIYLWGAQLELGSTANTYFPVGNVYPFHGACVDGVRYFDWLNGNTVSNNVVTEAQGAMIPLAGRGYLPEDSRFNLCLQSQDLATTWGVPVGMGRATNVTTAPDATVTADSLTDDSSTGGHYIEQSITLATNTTYTFSAFVKWNSGTRNVFLQFFTNAGADQAYVILNSTGAIVASAAVGLMTSVSAAVKAYPNGWFRVSVTGTTGATAGVGAMRMGHGSGASPVPPGYTGNGTDSSFWWGMQMEGWFAASSYIPTTVASVLRNADSGTHPAAGNALTSGTLYAECGPSLPGNMAFANIIDVSDGSVSNFYAINNNAAFARGLMYSGGISQGSGSGPAWTNGTSAKIAARFGTNTIQIAKDGVLSIEDTVATPPISVSVISIGTAYGGTGARASIPIRNLRILQPLLTDAHLQAITL